jgi:cellulose synthase/poly-beta-1,6-N-acetylglucosamine synthase-like glycosyltransferase
MCVYAMSQSLVLTESRALETGFSVGICAADRAANLDRLLEVVESEAFPSGLVLRKVVLVASGCDRKALAFARQLVDRDSRFLLIEEPVRRGKWAAINQIIDNLDGQLLVLVNSDALPERGAISKLLRVIMEDSNVGMVSASPIVGKRAGITGGVLQLMWGVHNECLLQLNAGNRNNHGCDELVVVRSEVLHKLPADTVNDGAFLAGNAYLAGYSIRFCETAKVRIDVPSSFVDLMRQRRRVVYGHFQIMRSVGQSPRTLESMLVGSPILSFTILIKTLARSPRLVMALPVAVIGEAASVILAMYDNLTLTKRHVMWQRYGSMS